MRVLIAGSRNWPLVEPIHKLVDSLLQSDDLTVGDCPTGADKIALDRRVANGGYCDVYHAEWNRFGKRAGPIRNKAMAQSGLHLAEFFWHGTRSPGTRDCMRRVLQIGYVPMVLHTTMTREQAEAAVADLEKRWPRWGIAPIEIKCYTV